LEWKSRFVVKNIPEETNPGKEKVGSHASFSLAGM